MKRMVTLVVLVAWLLNCAPTLPQDKYHQYERIYPIVISTHVGETIDTEEREQFGLFPVIEDFKAATFYGIKGGGYEVEILTTNKKLVAANRDPKGIEMLRNYIDSYAKMQYSKEDFEKKWKIVDYDYLGQPITEHEIYGNKKHNCCIGGALGCGFLGFLPVYFVAYFAGGGGLKYGVQNETKFYITYTLVMAVVIATGALTGNKISKDIALKTLKTIKEARKPRVVE